MNEGKESEAADPGATLAGSGRSACCASWGRLRDDLEAPPSGPRFRWRWVAVPLVVTLVATVFVRITGFDLAAQEAIYRAGGGSWALGDHPFWKSLYTFGTIPSTLVVLAALGAWLMSWSKPSLRRWRRTLLFPLLVGVVGPGILVNLVFKEYWGRPRPREVEGLGGHQRFEQVLEIDPGSEGKSFPCGHATMGFFFFGGFFLLRRHRRRMAEGFLVFGLVVGGLMGIARMAQGAHHFSDAIWAGAICWFAAMGVYYLMGLDRGLVRRGLPAGKMPAWTRLAAGGTVLVVLGAVLVASPYRDRRDWYLVEEHSKSGPLVVRLAFTVGEAEIRGGEQFGITGEAYGHGVPTSRIAEYFVEEDQGDYSSVTYAQRLSGWLAEVNEQLEIALPWERINRLHLDVAEADLWIDLEETEAQTRILVSGGTGTVRVRTTGRGVRVVKPGNATIVGDEEDFRPNNPQGGYYRIAVEEAFRGTITFEKKSRPKRGGDEEGEN